MRYIALRCVCVQQFYHASDCECSYLDRNIMRAVAPAQEARGDADMASLGSPRPSGGRTDEAFNSLLEEDEDFPSMY